MTKADLEKYGGVTPFELYETIGKLRFFMSRGYVPEVPNVMRVLNCLYAVIGDEFKGEIDTFIRNQNETNMQQFQHV